MTKKRSKCLFVIFTIILVICLIASFVNFTYPLSIKGNYYTYSNFVSNLKLGEDLGKSVRVVYRAELPDGVGTDADYNALRDDTIDGLKDILSKQGYKDVSAVTHGEDGIELQIGNILTDSDTSTIESLIGSPALITFSTNSDGSDYFANGRMIESVTTGSTTNSGKVYYTVIIEFKDEYKSMVEEEGTGTVYIYLGDTEFTEWTNGMDGGIIQLYSESFESNLDAVACANQIKAGTLSLDLTKTEFGTVSASFGEHTALLLYIIMAVLVVAGFALLIVKFKQIGLIACYNLLFFIVIGLGLLQSIPLVHINFAGYLAIGLCYILAVDGLMILLENAKKHYQDGTKLYIAFKMAFKDCLVRILFTNSLVAIVGFICMFMPVMSLQSLGWVAFVLPFVNVFTNLVLMRLFTNMYLPFNTENGEKCNFHKGGKNA